MTSQLLKNRTTSENLKYKTVTFRKAGKARFVVVASIVDGWNRLQEVPKLIDVASISILDPIQTTTSPIILTKKAFRDYDDILTPALPTEVEITTNTATYSGLLVKRNASSVNVITSVGLLEITMPYILRYTTCLQDRCESVIPRVNLFFEVNQSNSQPVQELNLTFAAGGFSWDSNYKAVIDFDRKLLTSFTGQISVSNETDLALQNVTVSFLSKTDENNYQRPGVAMMTRSAQFSTEQTNAGSAIYRLQEPVTILEKSLSSFNFVNFKSLPVTIEVRFDILQRPKHPVTVVKFKVPESAVDGIPGGVVECWDGTTWLTDTQTPMAAPSELVILHLGENAFLSLKIEMTINQLEEQETQNYAVRRSLYNVNVSIKNNSVRRQLIGAYHPIDKEVKDLKVSNGVKAEVISRVGGIETHDDLGIRIHFTIPALEPKASFNFQYSVTA